MRRQLLLVLICSWIAFYPANALESNIAFPSGNKNIRVEIYRPDRTTVQKLPLVILLHGAGGIEPTGGFFRQVAEQLEQAGFVVAIVRYFDRNGLEWADYKQMAAHFSGWEATVRDSITFLQKQPFVRSENIGVMGHSLGAQLALAEAASDRRVTCVVEMAGSLAKPINSNASMPPVLILHGDADTVVPIARERQLENKLKSLKASYEKRIYHGKGHTFDGVSQDIMDRTVEFFRRKLKD